MNTFKRLYLGTLIAICLALTGCGTDLALRAQADGSTDMSMSLDMGSTITNLLQALSGMAGSPASNNTQNPLLDARDISKALRESGFTDTEVIVGSTKLIASATMPAGSSSGTVTQTKNTLAVTLSPDILQAEYLFLSEPRRAYLDLLMAPVLTGEDMTEGEYVELIAAVYGNDLATELTEAKVSVALFPPAGCKIAETSGDWLCPSREGSVQTVALFSVPLVTLLTLSRETQLKIRWE